MRTLLLALLWLPFAEASDCGPAYRRFQAAVQDPTFAALKQIDQPLKDSSTRKRFLAALEKLSDEQIRNIFNGPKKLSREDLDDLWWAAQTRAIKADSDTLGYISMLREMVKREPALLAGHRSLPVLFRRTARRVLDGKGDLNSNLLQAEETLLAQAILEGRGVRNASNAWYDRFLNYFSPHSSRMRDLIDFNADIRKSIQQFGLADEPVNANIEQYREILTPSERSKLEDLVSDTQTKIAQQAKIVEKVYGRDISSSPLLEIGEVRLRELGSKASSTNTKLIEAVKGSEKDMDVLDSTLDAARQRAGQPPRTAADLHPRELQIRHTQWKREMADLQAAHDKALEKAVPNSAYDVHAYWTVTVQHSEMKTRTVSKSRQGHDGNTEYYTEQETYWDNWTTSYGKSGDFTLDASYQEVLNGAIEPDSSRLSGMLPSATAWGPHAVSASNGSPSISQVDTAATKKILARARNAREAEKPVRDKMDEVDALVQTLTAEHNKGKLAATQAGHEATLGKIVDELTQMRRQNWEKYHGMTDAEIKASWPDDTVANFRERNRLQDERFDRLIKFSTYMKEQVSRGMPDLELTYDVPNFTRELGELEAIRKRIRTQQIAGAGLGVTATGGGAYYFSDEDRTENARWQWNKAREGAATYLQGLLSPEEPPAAVKPPPVQPRENYDWQKWQYDESTGQRL